MTNVDIFGFWTNKRLFVTSLNIIMGHLESDSSHFIWENSLNKDFIHVCFNLYKIKNIKLWVFFCLKWTKIVWYYLKE